MAQVAGDTPPAASPGQESTGPDFPTQPHLLADMGATPPEARTRCAPFPHPGGAQEPSASGVGARGGGAGEPPARLGTLPPSAAGSTQRRAPAGKETRPGLPRGLLGSRPRQDRRGTPGMREALLQVGGALREGAPGAGQAFAPRERGPPAPRGRAHRCFFSSGRARAASQVCAWWHGRRGLSGCFPERPRPLWVGGGGGDQLAPGPLQHFLWLSPSPPPLPRKQGSPGRPPTPTRELPDV